MAEHVTEYIESIEHIGRSIDFDSVEAHPHRILRHSPVRISLIYAVKTPCREGFRESVHLDIQPCDIDIEMDAYFKLADIINLRSKRLQNII
jgi:hypothetical protein